MGKLKRKAVWCENCIHYNPIELYEEVGEGETKLVGMEFHCDKGHKPYFYKPKDWDKLDMSEFGYKRRCEDYVERGKDE